MNDFEVGFKAGIEAAAKYSDEVSDAFESEATDDGDLLAKQFRDYSSVIRAIPSEAQIATN